MRVVDCEPMVNMYEGSAHYGKPFGVKLRYADGHTRRFSDIGVALCADLTVRQRKYVKDLQAKIEADAKSN